MSYTALSLAVIGWAFASVFAFIVWFGRHVRLDMDRFMTEHFGPERTWFVRLHSRQGGFHFYAWPQARFKEHAIRRADQAIEEAGYQRDWFDLEGVWCVRPWTLRGRLTRRELKPRIRRCDFVDARYVTERTTAI